MKFAEEHKNNAAMREFGIAESNIRVWHKQKDILEKIPKTKHARCGDVVSFPELEQEVNDWILLQ